MLTLVYPFYHNSDMLRHQYEVWAGYPDDLKDRIEVVIVDDGSKTAKDVPRPEGLPALRIFEIKDDFPWNQDAARNIGAKESDYEWLFMLDMDHVVPEDVLRVVLSKIPNMHWDSVGTFGRWRMDDRNLNPAPNIYTISRETFWQVGGYDERLSGYYGTDIPFRERLYQTCKPVGMRARLHVCVPSLIGDCATKLSREVRPFPVLDDRVVTLSYPYEQVYP